jgi:transposase-like protein
MQKTKIVNYYSDEEKLSIIQDYLTSGKSAKEIHLKYKIHGHSKLQDWMIKFGLRNKNSINKNLILKKVKKSSSKGIDLNSAKRIKELEQQLEEERLRSVLLDTMIDIAEEQLHVSIRKKSGAKQLKK